MADETTNNGAPPQDDPQAMTHNANNPDGGGVMTTPAPEAAGTTSMAPGAGAAGAMEGVGGRGSLVSPNTGVSSGPAAGATNPPGGNDAAPTNPTATDPGVSGGSADNGGRAVPDAGVLESDSSLGDTGSLDDSGGPGSSPDDTMGVSPTPGTTSQGVEDGPAVGVFGGQNARTNDDADVPTGGLNAGGTIGGTPTGAAGSGLGDEGR